MFFLRIDRYITSLFLGFLISSLVIFVTLYVAIDFISNMNRFEASPDAMIRYYLFAAPGLTYQLLPVACLLGVMLTLSHLSRQNELTALFSFGMSLVRVASPLLFWVLLISASSFWISDRLLPILSQKKNYELYVNIRKQPGLYSTVKTNKIWYRSGNIIFNIKTLNPDRHEAQGLTMYYFSPQWQLIQMISAQEVHFKDRVWDLSQGTVTLFRSSARVPISSEFNEKSVSMGEDVSDLQSTSRTADILTLKELEKFITKNKEAGLDTVRYEVDYHAKWSFAFASFVMAMIGIPFSVSQQRSRGMAFNVGLCIGLAFLYWTSYSSGLTLGQHGILKPWIAAWLPNSAGLLVSLALMRRLRR